MNIALLFSVLLMGLAGSVHCLSMCSVPSAALLRACSTGPQRWAGTWAFHLARTAGYAACGAFAAASVDAVAQWSAAAAWLRPVWTLLHMAALVLGAWLLWTGRQPAWLDGLGRGDSRSTELVLQGGWQVIRGPAKAAVAGGLWFAWPCGLLQSALVVAALSNGAVQGAIAMAVFGTATALGLWVGARGLAWMGRTGSRVASVQRAVVRVSGAALVVGASWALSHDLWLRVAAYCGF